MGVALRMGWSSPALRSVSMNGVVMGSSDVALVAARAWWIVDSGHGWLAVPLVSCEGLTFSEYSYFDREAGEAYLEEDVDAGVWIRAHNLGRDEVRAFPVDHVDGDAWVRGLPRLVSPRSVV